MLIKNADFIPEKYKDNLADYYQDLVLRHDYYEFEWHCASLATLLSHKAYFRKKALLDIFKSQGKDISTYPSMIALEGLSGNLTRSEFITLRDFFDRCDEWEKRRLVSASIALPDIERKAWAKAIKSTVKNDILCYKYVEGIIKGSSKESAPKGRGFETAPHRGAGPCPQGGRAVSRAA